VLRVYQPGRSWSVWHFFHGRTGDFEGWYVNIEDPHVRTDRTTRSRDHVLDVWVEPDRAFERKVEDELALAVEQGRYSQREADAISATADEVEAVIKSWGRPFRDGWESFRPDPAWPIPSLP
jgi:predicted RNA-binding protein associated with RNAse of E/G family